MFSIPLNTIYSKTITIIIATGIHNGLVTHHQDQAIRLVNLSTRNTMNKIVPKPAPPAAFELSAMIYNLIGSAS